MARPPSDSSSISYGQGRFFPIDYVLQRRGHLCRELRLRQVGIVESGTQTLNQQEQLGSDLNNVALSQTARISNTLNNPLTASGLPPRGEVPWATPQATSFDAGGPIRRSVGPTDYSADRTKVEDAI